MSSINELIFTYFLSFEFQLIEFFGPVSDQNKVVPAAERLKNLGTTERCILYCVDTVI